MLGLKGAWLPSATTTWQPCYDIAAHRADRALAEHVRCVEERLYFSVLGMLDEATELAVAAHAAGQPTVAAQAELIALEVRSRYGESAAAKAGLVELLDRVPADTPLAGRIRLVLATVADRLGERTEASRWIRQALADWPDGQALHWRSEALMVSALNGSTGATVDATLMNHAIAEISAHGDRLLLAAALANFAEVSAESGDLAISGEFADAASALLRRHPELASTLTLDSIGRARLAAGELASARYCLELALRLEERLGCTDVQGDPWLTFAELELVQGQPDEAWQLLEHPRRTSWAGKCSWTRCRDLKLRAQVLAAQQHWEQAYLAITEHLAVYQSLRSVEGDRAVAEFATVQIADEERRRAAEFEKLALTDPLTGIANRRRVERWLAEVASGGGSQVGLAIIDLDHFKRVNDDYSHEAGDEVLRRVAGALVEPGATGSVLLARLGGEEFVLLAAGLDRPAVLARSERLLDRLRTLDLDDIEPGLRITASIGIAFGDPTAPSELLRAADRCLYQAKSAGRDRVVLAADPAVVDTAVPDRTLLEPAG